MEGFQYYIFIFIQRKTVEIIELYSISLLVCKQDIKNSDSFIV